MGSSNREAKSFMYSLGRIHTHAHTRTHIPRSTILRNQARASLWWVYIWFDYRLVKILRCNLKTFFIYYVTSCTKDPFTCNTSSCYTEYHFGNVRVDVYNMNHVVFTRSKDFYNLMFWVIL